MARLADSEGEDKPRRSIQLLVVSFSIIKSLEGSPCCSSFGEIPEKDDGSLSWEALRRNVRYLNVETRLGYLTKQKKMLRFIETTLN